MTLSVVGTGGSANGCPTGCRGSSPPPAGGASPGETIGDGKAEVGICEVETDGVMEFCERGRDDESKVGRVTDLSDGENTREGASVEGGLSEEEPEAPEKARRDDEGRRGEGVPGFVERTGTWRNVEPDALNEGFREDWLPADVDGEGSGDPAFVPSSSLPFPLGARLSRLADVDASLCVSDTESAFVGDCGGFAAVTIGTGGGGSDLSGVIPLKGGELGGRGDTLLGRIASLAGEVARVEGDADGVSGLKNACEDPARLLGGVVGPRLELGLPNEKAGVEVPFPFIR